MEKEKKQKTIGETSPDANEDLNMGKKKLDAEGIMTFLDGMGFEQDNGKQGLYKKILDDTEPKATAFWDFRSTPKGKFYVGNMGGGFWKDDEAKQLSEYIEVRKVIGDEEKKGSPTQPTSIGSMKVKPTEAIVLTQEQYLRGTEEKISRLIDTKLQLDSIIEASTNKDKPGEGLLYYELKFGKGDNERIHKEPSVELVDMIAQDMGYVTTKITEFGTNTLEDPNTHKKYLTYYCHVEAMDGLTHTSGIGASEQLIDFNEIERNGRTFARTNAIRKAERNAKERLFGTPRKAVVALVIRKLEEHLKAGKKKSSSQ